MTLPGFLPNVRNSFLSVGVGVTNSLSQIEDVLATLGAAVDHLESAAARVSSGDLLLAGELRDVREQNTRLEENARVVGVRLEATMDKLRTLIEE